MMGVERSEVQWGRTQIPYVIRRSSRRGTVSVAVDPSGQVVLTAPAVTPIDRLDRVVRQKARWIVERTKPARRRPLPVKREFVSGETVLYLGRNYRLRIVSGREAGSARLERGWLTVAVGPGLEDAKRSREVRSTIATWYRARAQSQLAGRAAFWSKRLRVQSTEVLIREPRMRWGSCDPAGVIRFNWRIIQAPPRLIDYVVVHELAHLVHRRHSGEFWATVGRVMPDYETRRSRLESLGPKMVW